MKQYVTQSVAIQLGFKELQHPTISDTLIFDLGRRRHLSLSNVNTPNEMLMICEQDEENPKLNSDVIVLHNYDYDGYLTKEKLTSVISSLTNVKADQPKSCEGCEYYDKDWNCTNCKDYSHYQARMKE